MVCRKKLDADYGFFLNEEAFECVFCKPHEEQARQLREAAGATAATTPPAASAAAPATDAQPPAQPPSEVSPAEAAKVTPRTAASFTPHTAACFTEAPATAATKEPHSRLGHAATSSVDSRSLPPFEPSASAQPSGSAARPTADASAATSAASPETIASAQPAVASTEPTSSPTPADSGFFSSLLSFVGGIVGSGTHADEHAGDPIAAPPAMAAASNGSAAPPPLELGPTSPSLLDASMPPQSSMRESAREISVASRLAHARQQRSLERAAGVKPKLGGGGETCVACGKVAYFAERKVVNNRIYHNQCFCCTTCKRKLVNEYSFTANEDGVECLYCLPHAQQQRVNNGTAGKV